VSSGFQRRARIAHGALLAGGEAGSLNVAAMVMMEEARAFTAGSLTARPWTNLVDLAGLATARDKPFTRTLVPREYLFAVQLEETVSSKDVLG
jgi:hypothetical protein